MSNDTEVVTDEKGWFMFTDVITGTYSLEPSKEGYIFAPAMLTVSVPPDIVFFEAIQGQPGEYEHFLFMPLVARKP